MPQRRQLTWTELRVGLFVLVGLSVLAAGIFYVTSVGGGPLSPKYRLKTYLPEVSGLVDGAGVKVDGVEVGNVESIRFMPRTAGKPVDRGINRMDSTLPTSTPSTFTPAPSTNPETSGR